MFALNFDSLYSVCACESRTATQISRLEHRALCYANAVKKSLKEPADGHNLQLLYVICVAYTSRVCDDDDDDDILLCAYAHIICGSE